MAQVALAAKIAQHHATTLLCFRIGALAIGLLGVWLVQLIFEPSASFPPDSLWATAVLAPINIGCLFLLRRFYHVEGLTLPMAMGVRRPGIGKDIGWGILWFFVLNIPFYLVIVLVLFVLFGTDFAAMGTIWGEQDSSSTLSPWVLLTLAICSVIPFILFNAVAEELVFRGYCQQHLGIPQTTIILALVFGFQHIFFAPTPPAMLIFFCAFTVWGLIAAVIVRRQGRLFPVIIAHGIINTLMSLPALVLPFMMV